MKDSSGNLVETPEMMLRRVAKAIAKIDLNYDDSADIDSIELDFYSIMANLEFLPNSPTLMNAGTDCGQLSACFVLPIGDSLESIYDTVKYSAYINRTGGGTGFSFSKIRPKGDIVSSTKGQASGPISFMELFDKSTDVIKEGGKRRGANMAILSVTHPDIIDFIKSKREENKLTNFNISVAVTDDFMHRVDLNANIDLINPRTLEKVRSVSAREIFDLIVRSAWESGDPGLVFIDEINRHNPTPYIGPIDSTNPCGEQPLLPYESCNLGSINLSRMVNSSNNIDLKKLGATVESAIHFLDNVIDANKFPLKEIEGITRRNRKIGLGVMGFADMLIRLNIPYDSVEALAKAEEIMEFISKKARETSVKLAEERGSFPTFEGSVWHKAGYESMRNATLTTIAPTGSISLIAGTSSGIEPLFGVVYMREKILEINPYFEEISKKRGFFNEDLILKISESGSVRNFDEIPSDVKRVFLTAFDIPSDKHLEMQAAFQRHCDNAVSKTINLESNTKPSEVERIFRLAFAYRLKGITIYRYGTRRGQTLTFKEKDDSSRKYLNVELEYSGGCTRGVCHY